MLNRKSIPLFGSKAKQAFGHLGFMNILNWADPQRGIVGALMTTGKPAVGPHLLSMLSVPQSVANHFD